MSSEGKTMDSERAVWNALAVASSYDRGSPTRGIPAHAARVSTTSDEYVDEVEAIACSSHAEEWSALNADEIERGYYGPCSLCRESIGQIPGVVEAYWLEADPDRYRYSGHDQLRPGTPDNPIAEAPEGAIACVLHESLERGSAHCYLFSSDGPLELVGNEPTATTIHPLSSHSDQ